MELSQKLFLSLCLLLVLSACENSIEKNKAHALVCFDYGLSHYQGTKESINGFAKAVELDPTHAEAWRELSIPFLKRGMPHLWKKYMDKAVALDPIAWQGYRGYNYLWFYRDYKSAIADFDATDTLTPNFTDAPQGHSVDFWRGIAYLGLKDYENSIAYFDKHIQTEIKETGEDWIEHEAFLYRGIALFEQINSHLPIKIATEKFTPALKDFNTVLKYNSDFADAKYYKALILYEECKSLQQNIIHQQQMHSSRDSVKVMQKSIDEKQQEALKIIEEAIFNFNNGYSNQRPYVETMRQLYIQDYENLKAKLEAMN